MHSIWLYWVRGRREEKESWVLGDDWWYRHDKQESIFEFPQGLTDSQSLARELLLATTRVGVKSLTFLKRLGSISLLSKLFLIDSRSRYFLICVCLQLSKRVLWHLSFKRIFCILSKNWEPSCWKIRAISALIAFWNLKWIINFWWIKALLDVVLCVLKLWKARI